MYSTNFSFIIIILDNQIFCEQNWYAVRRHAFGPLEDQIWKMRFSFPNVPYSCQIPLVSEHLTFKKGFLDNGILTLVKYLLIKVVAPLGHEQLLCPLSSSDIFLKVMDQTRKWDPQINRDRAQIYLFNSCLLQIVSSSGIISRNNHTLWNDVTSWQGSLYNQLEVSLILSLIIVQDLLLYHKDLWFIHNIILCQAYIYLFKQYRITVV